MRDIEVISKGRAVPVSESEIEDLRRKCGAHGWYRYCQLRLTMSHAEALAAAKGSEFADVVDTAKVMVFKEN